MQQTEKTGGLIGAVYKLNDPTGVGLFIATTETLFQVGRFWGTFLTLNTFPLFSMTVSYYLIHNLLQIVPSIYFIYKARTLFRHI